MWSDAARQAAAEARASHSQGIQKTAGRRFHVVISPYSLDRGKVGQSLGRDKVVSQHRSLGAAGDKLGSLISGNLSREPQAHAGIGNGYRLVVRDTMTGHDYSRDQARAIHQGKWNGALPYKAKG